MDVTATFYFWWNRLARRNHKVKFRNSKEAAEFVRRIANSSGPNQEMVRMRNEYVAIQTAKQRAADARSHEGGDRLLQ